MEFNGYGLLLIAFFILMKYGSKYGFWYKVIKEIRNGSGSGGFKLPKFNLPQLGGKKGDDLDEYENRD